MRNKAKKILCLLLAFLMVSGTLTWLISLIASADELENVPAVTAESGSGGEESELLKHSSTPSYRLEKVYNARKNAEDGRACYIKGDATKTSYDIQRGYYADFDVLVKVVFEGDGAADAAEDFVTDFSAKLKATVDSGSFSGVSGVSSVAVPTVTDKGNGIVNIAVDIDKVTYSGDGDTLGLTIYSEGSSSDFSESFTMKISQCVPYQAPTYSGDDDDDDEPDIPSATPYVIVSSYNYGGGNVTAGQEFTLNLTIKNTSKLSVGNMTVTVSTPEAFTLVNSSNTVYIETLGAGKTLTHSVKMMARASANPEPAVVGVNFDYQYVADDSRHNVERAEQIAIPVSQPDRFQVDELILPDQLWVGEEYDLEIKYVNKGRSTVYNLSAALQGEGLMEANQSEMVGNVESGKSGTIDFFLMTDMPGTLSGNVVVTYEDVNMNEKIITLPYSIEVMGMDEPVFEDPMAGIVYNEDGSYYGPDGILYGPDGMPMEENASGGWQTYAIVGGCVLAAVIAAVVVSKKRKAARLLAELEEDNNEDI